jgi:hypothetical protein
MRRTLVAIWAFVAVVALPGTGWAQVAHSVNSEIPPGRATGPPQLEPMFMRRCRQWNWAARVSFGSSSRTRRGQDRFWEAATMPSDYGLGFNNTTAVPRCHTCEIKTPRSDQNA